MAPSSTSSTTAQADPVVAQLSAIAALLDVVADREEKQLEQLRRMGRQLDSLRDLLEGFSGGGSDFRSYQLDPLVVAYAAILGPILGDRIDGQTAKGETYIEEMMKGAAVMARELLRTLDRYRSERGALDYLESAASQS